MKKTTKILRGLLIFFFLFILSIQLVYAQVETEIDYPEVFGIEPTKSLPDYVYYIYRFVMGGAGFLAMMMLIVGGIRLMASSGDPQRLEKAKKQVINAILGLVLLLISYYVIYTINPDLLVLREIETEERGGDIAIDDLIEDWKTERARTRKKGGNVKIGAIYGAGETVDCYVPKEDVTDEEGNVNYDVMKVLTTGDDSTISHKSLDDNHNHIFCCTWKFEANVDETEDWSSPEEDQDLGTCEMVCDVGSNSCPKIEGDIDSCDSPTTCAEIKEMGLKSDCEDSEIYCLAY